MKVNPDTKELETFIKGVSLMVEEAVKTCVHKESWLPIGIDIGPKRLRITKGEGGKSVYCFIDRETGDVLKAATWSKPAKHARGNIFDDSNGLGRCVWTGPEYLR